MRVVDLNNFDESDVKFVLWLIYYAFIEDFEVSVGKLELWVRQSWGVFYY